MTAVTAGEVEMTPLSDVPIDGATAEIPFVPASLRQTAKPEVIDDSIVVVGQRQKKRKRAKKAEATDDGDGDAQKSTAVPAKAKTKTEDVVPFDFASAPNILGDGERSEQEDGRAGKRNRQKKKKAQFGACGFFSPTYPASSLWNSNFGTCFAISEREDFPAPPKDRRDLRSGNVSRTFRS